MKKIIASVLVAVLCLALAACSKNQLAENPVTGYKTGDVTLGTYKGITYTALHTEVTDEDVQAAIDSLLSSKATTEEVTDRTTVQTGDIVSIDYSGKLDGVAFDGGTGSIDTLEIGSGQFIPGFEDQLIGKEKGDFSINVTFPESYPNSPELAGKPVVFDITLKSFSKKVIPELTDEFVTEVSEGAYTTVAAYREYAKQKVAEQYAKEDTQENQSNIIKAAIESSTYKVDLSSKIKNYADSLRERYDSVAKQSYGVDGATLYQALYGMDNNSYENFLNTQAEMTIKYDYLRSAVAEAENFELTKEDLDEVKEQLLVDSGNASLEAVYEQIKATYGISGDEYVEIQAKLGKAGELILDSAVAE